MARVDSTAGDNLEPALRFARRAARFWRPALIAIAIGLLATLAIAKLRPRIYRSEAVLHYREGLQWNPNDGFSARRMGQRLKETLLARSQLNKVVEELHLFPELVAADRTSTAVEEMLLNVSFKFSEGDIFTISYASRSREEAQRVVAKLTSLLVEENSTFRSSQAEVATEFLEAQKKRNEADLAAKEAEHFRFLSKHPEFLGEPGAAGGAIRSQQKPQAPGEDGALAALRREEQRLRKQIASPGPMPADPALVAARGEAEAKLKAAQASLAALRPHFTEEHPDVRSAAMLVKEAEEAYRRASEAAAASAGVVPVAELESRLAQVQRDITAAEGSGAGARVDRPRAGDPAQGAVSLESEWTRLSREVAEARERLQQLDSKQFMASMTLSTVVSGQAGQIVVIDPAFLPAKPIGMSNTRLLLLGLAASLALGGGLAVVLSRLDSRLRDHVDVERLDLAPLLIEVPKLEGDAGGPAPQAPPPGTITVAPARTPGTGRGDAVPAGGAAGADREVLALVPAGSGGKLVVRSGGAVAQLQRAAPQPRRPSPTPPPREEMAMGESIVLRERSWWRDSASVLNVHRVEQERGTDRRLLMVEAPDSPAAAAFRVLRHRLVKNGEPKVILVTSPNGGEGKTTCALNLALALGEAGRARVLLLEANFRRPSLARVLGFHPPVCIGAQFEVYREHRIHFWHVAETVVPWLHTAAVAPDAVRGPILDGLSLAACIEDLRRCGYDHIVVDCPPVLGSADVNLIQECVDGALLVVRAGVSGGRDLRKAVDQLGKGKLLGIAMLGT